jgi:hypothetical protein
MPCPNCNTDLKCPCDACIAYREKQDIPEPLTEIWIPDTENLNGDFWIKCPVCGFTATSDDWEDLETRLY